MGYLTTLEPHQGGETVFPRSVNIYQLRAVIQGDPEKIAPMKKILVIGDIFMVHSVHRKFYKTAVNEDFKIEISAPNLKPTFLQCIVSYCTDGLIREC